MLRVVVANPEDLKDSSPVAVSIADGAYLDAFSRLRTSEAVTIFDNQFEYDTSPLLWEYTTVGGGTATHLPNESSVRLRVSTGATDSVIAQTRGYHRYQPSKSQMIVMTGVLGAGATNVRRRIGLYDNNNGIFCQLSEGNLSFVLRSFATGSSVDTSVGQASWNLDKLDGSGPSGITIDPSKSQIFVLDLQWLGVGRVRCGFYMNGKIIYAHEFLNSNKVSTVYMTTANLPLRYEISNLAVTTTTHDLIAICQSVISEQGVEFERSNQFSASNGTTSIAVTTRRAILSVRPAATFNSIVNRGRIAPMLTEILATTNAAFFEIVYNPTFTGTPTWTAANASSIVEYSVHGDAAAGAFTAGLVVQSGFIPVGSPVSRELNVRALLSKLPLVLDAAGTNPIALSIVITSLSGTSNVQASIDWQEHR